MDRIDIHVETPAVQYEELTNEPTGESSAEVRRRVQAARQMQLKRFADYSDLFSNAHMGPREIRTFCKIDDKSQELLRMAITRLGLSARAYDRILKASRTIADLEGEEDIQSRHVAEAIQYRSLDRRLWE